MRRKARLARRDTDPEASRRNGHPHDPMLANSDEFSGQAKIGVGTGIQTVFGPISQLRFAWQMSIPTALGGGDRSTLS